MTEEALWNWIRKAENDFKIARDEMATEQPVTDAVCFHLQQCVEKYLKAYLLSRGAEIPRTHNLALLVARCCKYDSDFQKLVDMGVDRLTDYAVMVRYGEEFYIPSLQETLDAIVLAQQVREFVREKIKAQGFFRSGE